MGDGAGMFDLTGKVVWVTGAGKGLGRAMATAAAGAGARVVVTSRTREDLADLAGELTRAGAAVDVLPADVADPEAVSHVVAETVARAGRLDALINAAGISPVFTRSEHLPDGDWQHVVDTNLFGTFCCCREAGRVMLDQRHGAIVNVTSVHAQVGFQRIAAYAASKGGVEALTRTLAVEWADRGVRVNSLAPGYFPTELSSGLLNSRWGQEIERNTPMARVGSSAELTGAAVFLISDAASYMTGTTVTVDGGWTAR